jgi:2-dehydro-3-deoxygluconokinase
VTAGDPDGASTSTSTTSTTGGGNGVDVLTFGEALASARSAGLLRYGGALSVSLGGAETNVAIGLARLGHRARWVGRVGDDEFGSFVRRTLLGEGVCAEPVVDDARPTGVMFLERRVADISRVAYYRAGSAGSALRASDLLPVIGAAPPRILHATGITPALSESAAEATAAAVRAARDGGALISFDVNHRSKLWSAEEARPVLRELAGLAHIVFASDDELALVTDPGHGEEAAAVAELAARGVEQVVLKRGAAGATAWCDGDPLSVPARTVPVVDTVGAGDAFTAGYLSALLDGLPVPERLRRGAVLGAFAVSAPGDWESLPTRDELHLLDLGTGSTIR